MSELKKSIFFKDYFYYILLFVFVFFTIDMSSVRLLSIRGMNIYFGDLFFFLILLVAVSVIAKRGTHWPLPAAIWYLIFLAWLALEVILGWRIYGYRAFGESRFVLPFFAFFIPYILLNNKRSDDPELVGKYVRMTTYVATAASILFLFCSLIYRKPFYFSALNLKNQKLWFHKIISSDQSFYIILLAMFIFFLSFSRKKFFSLPKIVFFLLLFMALPVHNRTALVSLFFALLFLLAWRKKVREILFAGASVAVIFSLLNLVPNIERYYYPVQSQQQVPDLSQQQVPDLSQQQVPDLSQQQALDLNVEQVRSWQTGKWRFYQSKAALRLALKKPFFGQHLGGYFDFFIPEINLQNSYPPHNQYILILLKTGMIGLALFLAPFLLLLMRLSKFLADERLEKNERSTVWLLLLVLLAQVAYGLGYNFIMLYAIYFGFGTIFLDALVKKYPPQLRIKKK
jgi:hypothetical protein